MPITEACAREKLRRFAGYVPLPSREDLGRIVLAFSVIAEDPENAENIARALEKTLHFYPKISDLYEAAETLRSAPETSLPEFRGLDWRCPLCQDTGFIIRRRGETDFAHPCGCRVKPEEELAAKGAAR